jgi:hypothetical protein
VRTVVEIKHNKLEGSSKPRSRSRRGPKPQDVIAEVERQLGDFSIPRLYINLVLSKRTRRYALRAPANSPRVDILNTLLGIELRVGKRRINCPDLGTARYLSVFARLGCESVAVPYDITQVSSVADQMETGWTTAMLFVDRLTAGQSDRLRISIRRRLIEHLRKQIAESGAGAAIPAFSQSHSIPR